MPRIDHIHFTLVGPPDNPSVAITNGKETGIVGPDEVQRLMRELREAAGLRCERCRHFQAGMGSGDQTDCNRARLVFPQVFSGPWPDAYCADWEAKP